MNNVIKIPYTQLRIIAIAIVIFAACSFVQVIAIGSLPLLPFIGSELHISNSSMQLIIPVYMLGIITAQFITSFAAELYGRRKVYLLCLVIAVIGLLIWMKADNRWVIYSGIFLEAFGAGGLLGLSNAIIKDVFKPESHARMFGLLTIIMWVTAIVAPLMGGYLQQQLGWRFAIGVSAGFASTIFIFTYWVLPETVDIEKTKNTSFIQLLKESRHLFSNMLFMGSGIIGGALNALPTAFNTLAPFLLLTVFALPAQQIGIYLTVPGIGIFLGLICSELLGQRLSNLHFIRISVYLGFIASLFLVFMSFADKAAGLPIIVFVTSIAMFAVGLATPHYWSAALTPIKNVAAVASALIILSQHIFAMLTGIIISMMPVKSIMPMSATMIMLTFIALMCCILVLPKHEPDDVQAK